MILNRLRRETGQHHGVLERQLPLLSPQLTVEDYRRLLARFFGYYAALEERLLATSPSEEMFYDYTGRRKLPFLDHDLLALGSTVAELKSIRRCNDLPLVKTIADWLGCLYVPEGATLGGQIITRHLQTQLELTPESGSGYHVVAAGSVEEALRAAMLETFDLVLSDLGLPDGSGIQLMEKLRADHGLRGIALSGYGMEEDIARSKAAGFISHLVKPVRMAELRKCLTVLD